MISVNFTFSPPGHSNWGVSETVSILDKEPHKGDIWQDIAFDHQVTQDVITLNITFFSSRSLTAQFSIEKMSGARQTYVIVYGIQNS